MSDHERIWLQPECCACPTDGRLWCQDPDPVDCEEGVPWTEYIRADLAAEREREARGLVLKLSMTLWAHDPNDDLVQRAKKWLEDIDE